MTKILNIEENETITTLENELLVDEGILSEEERIAAAVRIAEEEASYL